MKALYLLWLLFLSVSLNAQTTWDGSSWDNDTPDNTTDAIITGIYITAAHGEFTAKNLDVTGTGNVTISSNTALTIQTNIDNLGLFTIEHNGALILIDDAGLVSGDYTVKRDSPDYPISDINSFWSSPIIEADANMASVFNSDDIVYFWDTSASPTFWIGPLNKNTTNFALGKGYAARPDNTTGVITRTFTGELNTGDVSIPVYYSDSSTSPGQFGYNIIGNPYPSAIDWFAFKEDNASLLSGTMYYWRQLETGAVNYASNYVALNYLGVVPYNAATEFIGTAQGFVAKTNATNNLIFKNAHRVNDNEQFFSTSQSRMQTQNNSWFNLEGPSNISGILIGFNANATVAFDDDYDGIFIGGTDPLQLYSLIGSEKLLINGQPELVAPNDVSISLGITTTVSGTYTISIEEEFISTDYFIKLEDTQTATITDLRLGDYTFSVASPGEDNTRFIMHYEYDATLGITEDVIDEITFKAFFKNDDLHIVVKGNYTPEHITLYNINGTLVYQGNYKSETFIPNLSSGTYVLKTNFDTANSISKILVKK